MGFVQFLLRLTREHRPDVIFMDIRMSDINGLDVTRLLKADPLTAGIPVIAVTASAFGASREAAKDAGCIDYLSKPVRAESLYAALHAHLGVEFVSTAAPPAPSDPELSSHSLRLRLAVRLQQAAGIGSVTDLEALAQELVSGDAGEAALGHRIARMTAQFDFDELTDLARRLAGEGSAPGVHD